MSDLYAFLPNISCSLKPLQQLQISQYILEGIEVIFSKIPPDHYILCVGYIVHGFVVDCQLGVTGTTLEGETAASCAEREVKEELSLVLPTVQLINSVFVKRQFKSQCFMSHTFVCDVSAKENTNPLNQQLIHNVKERVSVFVHGSLSDLERLLLETKFNSVSKDKAGYIGVLSLKSAKQIYGHIRSQRVDLRGTFIFDINKKKRLQKKCWCGSEAKTNHGSKGKLTTSQKKSQKLS